MSPIDFEAKTDRELLLLVAQQTNIITDESLPRLEKHLIELNGTLKKHDKRITSLERRNPNSWKAGSAAAGVGAFVAGAAYGVGKLAGWW